MLMIARIAHAPRVALLCEVCGAFVNVHTVQNSAARTSFFFCKHYFNIFILFILKHMCVYID